MATFSLNAEDITANTDINVALFQDIVNGINEALSYQFNDNLYFSYKSDAMTSDERVGIATMDFPFVEGSSIVNKTLVVERYKKQFTVQSFAPSGYQFDLTTRPFIGLSVGTGSPFFVDISYNFPSSSNNNNFEVFIDRLNQNNTGFMIVVAAPLVATS